MKRIFTPSQIRAAADAISNDPELREQVAHLAVVQMIDEDVLPGVPITVDEFKAFLAESLRGVPRLEESGRAVVQITPGTGGILWQSTGHDEWQVIEDAVRAVWDRQPRIPL